MTGNVANATAKTCMTTTMPVPVQFPASAGPNGPVRIGNPALKKAPQQQRPDSAPPGGRAWRNGRARKQQQKKKKQQGPEDGHLHNARCARRSEAAAAATGKAPDDDDDDDDYDETAISPQLLLSLPPLSKVRGGSVAAGLRQTLRRWRSIPRGIRNRRRSAGGGDYWNDDDGDHVAAAAAATRPWRPSTATTAARTSQMSSAPFQACNHSQDDADYGAGLDGTAVADLASGEEGAGSGHGGEATAVTAASTSLPSLFFATDARHPKSAPSVVHVERASIVDNAGLSGLYTGTLDGKTWRPHGRGAMRYSDDPLVYDGQWVDGDWCGFGTLVDSGRSHAYQGGFFDNYRHGLGVLLDATGRTYDGTFSLGALEGKGRLVYPDGTRYWGHWTEDGTEHGRGKKVFIDGRVYDGEFDNGVLHGHGRMTYPDGSWYLGEWMDGERSGLGMEVGPDGSLMHEGTFCHGRPILGPSCPPHGGNIFSSSARQQRKSEGDFLLYRSSIAPAHKTLVGNIPKKVYVRPERFHNWAW